MRILVPIALFLTSVSLVFAQGNVGAPAQKRNPNYPLQVLILARNASHDSNGGFWVLGRADLFTGQQEQGFDYQSDCEQFFTASDGDKRYSARWKKQNELLEILVGNTGTGKLAKCELKTELKQVVYEYDPDQQGQVITRPLTSSTPAIPNGSSSNR